MKLIHRSSEERNRIVECFLNSGVGVLEFCRKNDLQYSTFQKWRQAYEIVQRSRSDFVPVILKSQNETFPHKSFVGAKLVSPKGIVIEFDSRADHGWISQILRGVL